MNPTRILAYVAILTLAATWAQAATPPAATPPAVAEAKPGEAPAAEKLIAVIKTVEGTVESRAGVGQDWAPVKVGDQLGEGIDIRTGFRARCVLEMNKNMLQVDPLTVVRIGELRRDGDTVRTRILLKQGNTETNVQKGGTKNDYAIVTPTATLSVRGTEGVQAGFFQGFGGNYGLTGTGLINLASSLTGSRTNLTPGQNTNDNATPPGQVLAGQFLPNNIDTHAFEPNEQNANGRTHTGLPSPPLGGTSGGSAILGTNNGGNPTPPAPPHPKDDYGGFDYGSGYTQPGMYGSPRAPAPKK
jgi:hypothetical protein